MIPSRSRAVSNRGLKTKAWERRSRLQRMTQPLCEDCLTESRVTPATEAHHVNRRQGGGALLDGPLLSLCRSHHSQRTGNGE